MIACPKGAIVNHDELIILERACHMAAAFGEHVIKLRPPARRELPILMKGIRSFRRYERLIERVRKAKRRG
jgi:hypothetical protein